tara:strand:- start:1644 stop:1934 length:291 start_codon:yes stop_codon:yes gene_type:complete
MKRIKLFQDIALKYERKEKGSFISLYEDSITHPPFLITDVNLKDLVWETLDTKALKGIEKKYIQNVVKDLDEIKETLLAHIATSYEHPDFGFGDNT